MSLADADDPSLREDELERRADELLARLAGGARRSDRAACARHRQAGIVEIDVGPVREDDRVGTERVEGSRQVRAGKKEVVDRKARLAGEHLEAKDVHAVLRQMTGDRGEAAWAVADAKANESCASRRSRTRKWDERRLPVPGGEVRTESWCGRVHACSFESTSSDGLSVVARGRHTRASWAARPTSTPGRDRSKSEGRQPLPALPGDRAAAAPAGRCG